MNNLLSVQGNATDAGCNSHWLLWIHPQILCVLYVTTQNMSFWIVLTPVTWTAIKVLFKW